MTYRLSPVLSEDIGPLESILGGELDAQRFPTYRDAVSSANKLRRRGHMVVIRSGTTGVHRDGLVPVKGPPWA